MAYRRRVVRRAESRWFAIFALFAQAIRRASWASIRANPGPAIASAAIAVWVVAAVTVTTVAFAGLNAAAHLHALTSLIAQIDAGREDQPLASACRVTALAWAGRS